MTDRKSELRSHILRTVFEAQTMRNEAARVRAADKIEQLIEAEASRQNAVREQLAYEAGLETYDVEAIKKEAQQALLDELEDAKEFAEDVLQQFGYDGKSGGLSTLEWAESIIKRAAKRQALEG